MGIINPFRIKNCKEGHHDVHYCICKLQTTGSLIWFCIWLCCWVFSGIAIVCLVFLCTALKLMHHLCMDTALIITNISYTCSWNIVVTVLLEFYTYLSKLMIGFWKLTEPLYNCPWTLVYISSIVWTLSISTPHVGISGKEGCWDSYHTHINGRYTDQTVCWTVSVLCNTLL